MSTCPCCHKPLPDAADASQLCSECLRALDTGVDESSPVPSSQQSALQKRPVKKRPLIITLLAIQYFLNAAAGLLFSIILLSSAKTTDALMALWTQWLTLHPLSFNERLKDSLLCLLFALLIFLMGKGLWQGKNWARLILIAIFMLETMFGGAFSLFWPLPAIFQTDPVLQILGRVLTFAMVCYLFSPSVKTAFGVSDLRWRWLYACAALALFSLVSTLYHAKAELEAWRWHRQHGNQISFAGITFPVYRGYTPQKRPDGGFSIEDKPSQLRPNDGEEFITVESCPEDCTLTPRQLAEKKFESYKKAGYTDVKFVQRQVKGETLECVDVALFSRTVECYGTGPIGHIFFAGNEKSFKRFNLMLTEAH